MHWLFFHTSFARFWKKLLQSLNILTVTVSVLLFNFSYFEARSIFGLQGALWQQRTLVEQLHCWYWTGKWMLAMTDRGQNTCCVWGCIKPPGCVTCCVVTRVNTDSLMWICADSDLHLIILKWWKAGLKLSEVLVLYWVFSLLLYTFTTFNGKVSYLKKILLT